ncbi:hypothetical protein E3N88_45778 [Mikania micrantha]|uniref:Cytochrome P450 n=1 Tax=Mikania micrantha TaxID=192012 RepID=A0A5N6LAI3_9ASTR|nr:hypothetical protein E3N88_45778 [Mikania micrantha]
MLLARGLANVEGDQWVKHRKIINPAFHVEKLKENGESSKGDLLGILLDSNDKVKLQGYTTFGLSIDEVIEECKLFYIGGQETTASLLVWTMILLGEHAH